MTSRTPEEYRGLADDSDVVDDVEAWAPDAAAALRAAADQLEAVQELHRWLRKNIGSPALHARLDQFTADTAPQDGRDD